MHSPASINIRAIAYLRCNAGIFVSVNDSSNFNGLNYTVPADRDILTTDCSPAPESFSCPPYSNWRKE
jgi:hypothetical protein